MDHNITTGSRIKALRRGKGMIPRQLSGESGSPAGFLSQLERDISSIAIDPLPKIAEILGVTLSIFFDEVDAKDIDPAVHSFDIACTQVNPQIIQFILGNEVTDSDTLSRILQLMSLVNADLEKLEAYCHNGKEFIYVLKGIVTVFIGDNKHCPYPGGSIQTHSNRFHNQINFTNRIARILTLNYPNPFKSNSPDSLNP